MNYINNNIGYENSPFHDGTTLEGLKAIDSALELSAYEHKKLERHKTLAELADDNVVYMIKRNVNYLWVDYHFDKAKEWLNIKSQKYDKRKKYAEKDAYDYLVDKLKEIFQVENLEIVRMCYEGYEQYTRWIDFITDSDYIFHITVPVIKILTVKLLSYTNCGKIALGYHTSKNCIRTLNTSYNVEDLKSTMTEILTLEDCKKHLSKTEKLN